MPAMKFGLPPGKSHFGSHPARNLRLLSFYGRGQNPPLDPKLSLYLPRTRHIPLTQVANLLFQGENRNFMSGFRR
uniref:Uncharacterized protein n=1 Tax=Candidatus Kentrum sp. FM TaxID=2126340 RepID=A0A450WM10_9GAMM|nr:MAG: hypothetical protein BECKFM1743A_GA0114220_105381 [Candidatus Kentron sp. FM]VFJ72249.1 MAG: hypothetical protein BECKFM1743C_GA0114222_106421 [Candidatus Kentron sp. FM]VFK18083.1 MAG: hypothetical protein BECKFM1743B_GA0114221_105234 [Candidatus Kentron sp. FM]